MYIPVLLCAGERKRVHGALLNAQRAARAAPSVYKRHVPLIPALVRREAAVRAPYGVSLAEA